MNQEYTLGFAGDRIATKAVGKELWAKPLANASAAVVLFNRNGTTYKCNVQQSIECPCNDYANATFGAQSMTLKFSSLAIRGWLGKQMVTGLADGDTAISVSCEVTDVYAHDGASAASLGRFSGSWTDAAVPPHGVRFLIIGNCTTAANMTQSNLDLAGS
eukprot:SAG31_NODE_4340_length_3340_cov_3.282012_5_plen_160_part_00